MTSDDNTAARFRKRAEELRAEASETADPGMRDKLLKLAQACEEMATRKLPKGKGW
jgi:DNA-directed RNA polymerase subunit K/omega